MKRYNLGWFFKYPNGYIILGIFEAYIFWGIFSKTIFKISKMDILGSTEMSNFEVPERVFGKSIQNIWSDTGMLSFWDFVRKCCYDKISIHFA